MPKFNIMGTNRWGNIMVYLHKSLYDMKAPTPFCTRDIHGNEIFSKMQGENYKEPCEVELKAGDYIMLITPEDVARDGKQVCGHMHYYNGKELISVYTKQPWNSPKTAAPIPKEYLLPRVKKPDPMKTPLAFWIFIVILWVLMIVASVWILII